LFLSETDKIWHSRNIILLKYNLISAKDRKLKTGSVSDSSSIPCSEKLVIEVFRFMSQFTSWYYQVLTTRWCCSRWFCIVFLRPPPPSILEWKMVSLPCKQPMDMIWQQSMRWLCFPLFQIGTIHLHWICATHGVVSSLVGRALD
jgi:hypothetical protein